jgi:antitoxin VapB
VKTCRGSCSVRSAFSSDGEGDEVRIRRHGNAVILEPMAEDWTWLDSVAGKLDEDFVQAVDEQPEPQLRPALEKLFR